MNQSLGDRIKEKRQQARLSAEDLALKLGLKKENIYKWERGSKPSDPEEYKKVTDWLNNLEYVPREIKQESSVEILILSMRDLILNNTKLVDTNQELVLMLKSNLSGTGEASQPSEEEDIVKRDPVERNPSFLGKPDIDLTRKKKRKDSVS